MKDKPAQAEFNGKSYAKRLPTRPGVYLMRDEAGQVLYVGKAADLRKRVSSYFDSRPKIDRIMRMVARIQSMEVSLTRSESEALLLENEWIKSHKPRYNILLRDDKSYPWIAITTAHEFPRIAFYRGARDTNTLYFGPYPSASSTRESISMIQKIFRIRNCEDSYFAHRSRPCLQYQIHRCTAPCVGLVSAEDYAVQVSDATLFLQGKNKDIIDKLIARMEQASARLDFELAASVRDQIRTLKEIQAQQYVSGAEGDIDFIAVAQERGKSCVQVLSFRAGRNLGQRSYFPSHAEQREPAEVLDAFLGQFYQQRLPPPLLVTSDAVENQALLQEVFSEMAGRKVKIQPNPRGDRRQILLMTHQNARQSLGLRLASEASYQRQLEDLQQLLGLDELPTYIECFDISHISGNETVGSCVAFGTSGADKSRYRRYILKDITPGDDYAAMRQVLQRRYQPVQQGEGELPDLLLIDGGKGQLKQAIEVLAELGISNLPMVGIAKGPSRRAGHEEWVRPQPQPSLFPGPGSAASHLVQQIRDEAHRFAITGHRGRRSKSISRSGLESIPGVGPKRRKGLLSHFGGLQGVKRAGIEELSSVPGINQQLAEQIYRALH
ncbi:MAG TPA: excinuclease ABC subunit UvrC [Xanthomonadales bacterium]|nr:excinuclease ABC subunit UvrC [Xanthomonadales bacterium]